MAATVHPLVIQAITLRGLGSYLDGARLEIRPLTILCGTNGSGKSTWFRMLRILQESVRQPTFPFSLLTDPGCGQANWHSYTNPHVALPSRRSTVRVDERADLEFGPVGTVGLDIKCVAPIQMRRLDSLPEYAGEREHEGAVGLSEQVSLPRALLCDGRCPEGTRFRIRITDPTEIAGIQSDKTQLERRVELVVNETYSIRFESRYPAGIQHYSAFCTGSFWPRSEPGDVTDLAVAQFDLDDSGALTNLHSVMGPDCSVLAEWFCRTAISRIKELLRRSIRGVKLIRAERIVEERAYIDRESFRRTAAIRNRYVGAWGENTQVVARRFAYNEMRLPRPVGEGSIDYRFDGSGATYDVVRRLLHARDSPGPSAVKRIWESASDEARSMLNALLPWEEPPDARSYARLIVAVRILNEALLRRDLYDPDLWPELDQDHLVAEGVGSLNTDELLELNRNLIEAAFPDDLLRHPGLVFETFYAAWLKHLLGIRLGSMGASATDAWRGGKPPCGYLLRFRPDRARRSF